jgi:hypothetical protein
MCKSLTSRLGEIQEQPTKTPKLPDSNHRIHLRRSQYFPGKEQVMPRRIRFALKWLLRGLIVLILLEGLHVATVAYPRPLFPHSESFGEFTVFSRNPITEDFRGIAADARLRIQAMEHAHPGAEISIFLCDTEKLYSFFAFLTRRGADSYAIGLSIFDNMYLNETKIRRAAARRGRIRHSRFEGNFAEVIAHEVAHFNIVDEFGYRTAVSLPVWKSEGYAEYQANLAATRADSSYKFGDRITLLRDDSFWGGSRQARAFFEWQLFIEYLADVRGYSLEDIISEKVTEETTGESMYAWYRSQSPY